MPSDDSRKSVTEHDVDKDRALADVGYLLELVRPGMTVDFADGTYAIQVKTADPEVVRFLAEEYLCRSGLRR